MLKEKIQSRPFLTIQFPQLKGGRTLYYLSFAGARVDNTWKAQVSISDGKSYSSDGKSSILFIASAFVAPPPCVNDRSYRYNGVQKK